MSKRILERLFGKFRKNFRRFFGNYVAKPNLQRKTYLFTRDLFVYPVFPGIFSRARSLANR